MKTQSQNTAELSRLCELIKDCNVAMLTTHDGSDMLVSRPMSPQEMDADGALWFFTDRHSQKVDQLRNVNLAFSDEDRSSYVSVSGTAHLVDDPDRVKRLWSAYAKPWFPEGPESPNLTLLKVVPNTAEYWDAPHNKMVRMVAFAASIISGKPVGMGENETLTGLSSN